MAAIQQALKTMKDIDIVCGPIDGDESQTELVSIQWVENDVNFNIGLVYTNKSIFNVKIFPIFNVSRFVFIFSVISPIDRKRMDGVPSIRVHHGLNYANSNHIIRWTEVFILKVTFEYVKRRTFFDSNLNFTIYFLFQNCVV